ncbi:methyl-accepting chemotaxis protein [Caldimonas tepidiphila]|uniref:methyl-accepting chemotaxis protein n=1 Tax=Caldimonas tepidiphila TaxID=2315841 RepID=UPI000E5B99BF|nr:methyl-accepting chemotaxis protein [Caldimonas tepidiphila]
MKSLIENLRFSQKFLLIGSLSALLLAVPAGLLVKAEMRAVAVAKQEVTGLAPADAVLKLLRLAQQHRGMSAVLLGGNESQAAAREAKQAEVGQALERTRAALAALDAPRLAEAIGRIDAEWKDLSAAVGRKAIAGPDSFGRHTALIGQLLELVEDITIATGISLHAEPAGYFLHVAVLQHLPQVTESLGRMRAQGSLLLSRGSATAEEKAAVGTLAASTRQSLRGARKALELATGSDPELAAALAAPMKRALEASDEGLRLVDAKILQADVPSHPSADYFAAMTRVIDAQFELMGMSFEAFRAQLEGDASALQRRLALLVGGLAALGALALWLMVTVSRGTTASVRQAVELAEAVAAGDLSREIKASGRDEMAQLLRALATMNGNLAQVVGTVRSNADSVATASAQIAQGNGDLSQRTEEQASALQQTAASMEQLGSTVRQNADNARQADQLSHGASSVARRGGEVVAQVVSTMKSINDSSRQIADIINVIEGIAFQTNILALNAAVEAARAGEQGRGFAVVAGEVRALAQRSAAAAKEIKGLILASVERVEQGSTLVDQAGSTMNEIVASIKRVSDIMAEISAASTEQSAGVAQVGAAVSQMDRTTQQNAALVEESAAAAESLSFQARELVRTVEVFKLARTAAPVAAPAAAGDWQGF